MDQHQRGNQCRLAILSRDREDGAADAAATVGAVRLVNVADEALLPLTQQKAATLPFARWDL
jgi:hypothetical protein